MSLLEVRDLNVFYGAIHALKGPSVKVEAGEIVTLLGSNGAGKTTFLRAISGLLPIKSGSILYKGTDITKMKADKIVGLGISHSPEGRLVFPDMSVKENLELGAYLRKDSLEKDYDFIYELFPRLKEREKQLAGTLSGGEQQMVAIARALMAKPDLLLLDEPSLGIAPLLVQSIFRAVKKINEMGMTVLLVEQNANAALKVAHTGHVLETGQITLSGKGSDLLTNDKVREAYLG